MSEAFMTCSELYCLVRYLLNITTCIYITSILLSLSPSLSLSHTHTHTYTHTRAHMGGTWSKWKPGQSSTSGKVTNEQRELVFVRNPAAHGDLRVTLWWLTFPQLCVRQNEALHQRQASVDLLHGQHAEQAPQAVWNNNSRSESLVIHNSNKARVSHTHMTWYQHSQSESHTHDSHDTKTARVSHTHMTWYQHSQSESHTYDMIPKQPEWVTHTWHDTNTARVSHTHMTWYQHSQSESHTHDMIPTQPEWVTHTWQYQHSQSESHTHDTKAIQPEWITHTHTWQ